MEKIIKWDGMDLAVRDFSHSHAGGGRLGKVWAEDKKTGRVFLIKGSGVLNFEPFSEKIAYIIGRDLGIDVLKYDIIPMRELKGVIPNVNPLCPYASICEKIDRKGYSIMSIAEIKRAQNAVLKGDEKSITNREIMYELLPKQYIDTMLLFDAIIGNVDRHYGNVHVLRGTDGSIIAAPILDNGASILASIPAMVAFLTGYKVGKIFDKSYTTETTHDKQLESVDSINNINFNIPMKTLEILNDIQPTLDLMPRMRAKVIKKYLVYRLHKYLGMIKYNDSKKYLSTMELKPIRRPENEWS